MTGVTTSLYIFQFSYSNLLVMACLVASQMVSRGSAMGVPTLAQNKELPKQKVKVYSRNLHEPAYLILISNPTVGILSAD